MARLGTKSLRNQPELYSEKKTDTCLSLTKTAVKLLDEAAKRVSLSRSELVEQVARRLIQMPEKTASASSSADLSNDNLGTSDGANS